MITTKNVAAGFDEVAPRYDLMVALNPGYHAHLRAAADALIDRLPRPEVSNGHSSGRVCLILVAGLARQPGPCCRLPRRRVCAAPSSVSTRRRA